MKAPELKSGYKFRVLFFLDSKRRSSGYAIILEKLSFFHFLTHQTFITILAF